MLLLVYVTFIIIFSYKSNDHRFIKVIVQASRVRHHKVIRSIRVIN